MSMTSRSKPHAAHTYVHAPPDCVPCSHTRRTANTSLLRTRPTTTRGRRTTRALRLRASSRRTSTTRTRTSSRGVRRSTG